MAVNLSLFIPFLNVFAKWLENKFTAKDSNTNSYASADLPLLPVLAVDAMRTEVENLFQKTLQFNKNILVWADEVIAEIKKVVWPPTKDTRGMTIVVVIMVLISSVIVSVFDMFSGFVLNQLMK